jgi:hypothetical protein
MTDLLDAINALADTPAETLEHLPKWVRTLSEICKEAREQANQSTKDNPQAARKSDRPKLTLSNEKWRFLEGEFLTNSIDGALQHAGIYSATAPDKRRNELREHLRDSLRRVAREYEKSSTPVSDQDHYRNIQSLADEFSSNFGGIMKDRFRVGVAQKALNLYLKYLWCWGRIPIPPHCPFDSTVLRELDLESSWTRSFKIESYKSWVEHARAAAGTKTLAEWELRLWNRR